MNINYLFYWLTKYIYLEIQLNRRKYLPIQSPAISLDRSSSSLQPVGKDIHLHRQVPVSDHIAL